MAYLKKNSAAKSLELHRKHVFAVFCCCFFVVACFGSLRPSQQLFSHTGTIFCLPDLNQINCLAQRHNTVTPPAVSLLIAW